MIHIINPETFNVEIDVTENGGQDNTGEIYTIQVNPANPTALVSGDSTAIVGSTYTLNTNFIDPRGESPSDWIINWGDSPADTEPSADSYSHTYTSPGVYHVNATAETQYGNYTSSTIGVAAGYQPPSTPELWVSNTEYPQEIQISWDASTPTVTAYHVERSTDGVHFTEIAGNVQQTQYDDTGLAPATTYYYRVRAENDGAFSPYSTVMELETIPTVPGTPTATPQTPSTMSVTWTAVSGATSYDILREGPGQNQFSQVGTCNGTAYTDSGLSPQSLYSYEITAVDNGGSSAAGNPASATTPVAPSVPTDLTAAAVAGPAVSLSWSASTGTVTAYHVERSGDGVHFSEIAGDVSGTTYTDSGAQAGATYTYRVRAEWSGTFSGYSSTQQVTLPPTSPSDLTAVAEAASVVVINWVASSGTVTAYHVERSTDGVNFTEIAGDVPGTADTYIDNNVQAGASYIYRVRAELSGAFSDYSNAQQATLPPAPPWNLAVVGTTDSSVSLIWNASSGATEYVILREDSGGSSFQSIGTSNQLSFTDSNLTPSTDYLYKVEATNVGGASLPTTVVPATTLPGPTAPTHLTAATGSGPTVTLNWNASAGTVAGYHVERSTDGVNFTEIAGNVPEATDTYTDTSVESGINYFYRVRADWNGAYSDYSNVASLAPPTPADLVVLGLAVTGTDSSTVTVNNPASVTLSWTASPGATGYQIERTVDGPTDDYDLTYAGLDSATTYTDIAVLPGMTYTYTVQACADGFVSADSQPVEASLAPAAPTNVLGEVSWDNSVTLSWDPSIGAADYTILRQNPGDDGSFSSIGSSATPTFTDSNPPSGDVQYEVIASNDGGSSNPSAPATLQSPWGSEVVGRRVFYNDSVFDGNDPTINANDDNAIATDKEALLPGQGSTFANITTCTQGIDGIMVDIANLSGTPTASDFSFLVGTSADPSTWTAGPAPSDVEVRPGAGVNGSDRVEIVWPSGTIRNEWLQVTVKADSNTGLSNPDVFCFGNLIGSDTGTVVNDEYVVTANDFAITRSDLHGFLDPTTITDPCDLNRDGKVDATDMIINQNADGDELPCIVGAPGTPYLINAGGGQVQIGWPASSDPNVTGYEVIRFDGQGDEQQFAGITGTTCTDTTVTSGTIYFYEVIAQDAEGNSSAPTIELSITPSPLTIAPIANQTAGEEYGPYVQISTTFSDLYPSHNDTAIVNWEDGGESDAQIESGDTITASHLYGQGGVYNAELTLTDPYGDMATALFTVDVVPSAPTDLVATATSDTAIELAWSSSSRSADDFEIQLIDSNGSGTIYDQVPASQLSYAVTGLTPGDSYTFQIVADNSAGQSSPSNTASATTQAAPTPTISSQASSSGGGTVTGTIAQLSVGATDSEDGSDLTYTWTAASLPSGAQAPIFSDNADNSADSVTATFSSAGSYTFEVTVTDADGGTSSSQTTVNVEQTTTSLIVTPPVATAGPDQTQQLSAIAEDQFGNDMESQPQFTWSVTSGGGSVDSSGLFTAPSGGSSIVEATTQGVSAQVQITVGGGIYQVTLTGRAYEPGYSASNASDGLSVTDTGWIAAASPEAAVQEAVSGSSTLDNPSYDDGHATLEFPQDLGSPYGFALLAGDSETAPNQFVWNSSTSTYTGAIGMWDGDSNAPNDWDFYWNVSVATAPVTVLNDIRLTDDANPVDTMTDSAAQPQPAEFNIAQQSDGTATLDLAADFSPPDAGAQILWSITGGAVNGPGSGSFGSGPTQIDLNPGSGDNQYVLDVGVDANGDGVLAAGEVTEVVDITAARFLIEQESFGADPQHANDFHPVRLDPTPNDFSAHDLTGPQWQDLDHSKIAGDVAGEINGPICYTRSGVNGDVTMTVKADIYAPGANANTNYRVKAMIQGTNLDGGLEGIFNFNPVAAAVGTLNNPITGQQDTIITANLTGSDFYIPSVIRNVKYTLTYSVSVDGGKTWTSAGQAQTQCYVINGPLPASWTYNHVPDRTTGVPDPDTNPLWTVLSIACGAADGLAVNPGGNFTPVINAIWGAFANDVTAGVPDARGVHMVYWGPKTKAGYPNSGLDTGLIANDAGPCGGWASLLVDCLRAEGIPAYVYAVIPQASAYAPPTPGDTFDGFVVSSKLDYQGGKGAPTAFTEHAIVELTNNGTGAIYDPSYGAYYASAQAWRDKSEAQFQWVTPSGGTERVDHQHGKADSQFTLLPV